MPFITWNPNLELGIEKIDSQHMMLVDMINELYDAIVDGKSLEKMSDILTGLLHYAENHFATEEQFFDKYNYPEARAHINEHNQFITKISSRFDKLRKGEMILSVDISRYLRDWLLNHVMVTDMKFKPFLKEKGII